AAAAVAEAAGLAEAVAEEVELGAAGVGAADDLELGDHRAVDRELALDADLVDDAADRNHLVGRAALAGDEDALEDLDPLLVALDDADVDVDRVTDVHDRDVGLEGGRGEGLDDGLAG